MTGASPSANVTATAQINNGGSTYGSVPTVTVNFSSSSTTYVTLSYATRTSGSANTVNRVNSGGSSTVTAYINANTYGTHTNKLLCAYNRCPNVYSFFYMADITYGRLKACEDAYYANLQRGLKNAAHKELSNVQDIINRNLSPQLFQLEKELDKHGRDFILRKYPQLLEIVNNIESIKQEMRIWKAKQ